MTQSLLIDHVPGETRVALVEDGELVEIKIERAGHESHVGNIYLGRIEAVETALDAAFVTLPDGPSGYLSVKDAAALSLDAKAPDAKGTSHRIDRLVHEGQTVLVEIVKDAAGDKGPQLTTRLSCRGRHMVYHPFRTESVVSAKITDKRERKHLLGLATEVATTFGEGAFTVRTAANSRNDLDLRAEAEALHNRWRAISELARTATAPALLHHAASAIAQALRDWVSLDITEIVVDGHALLAETKQHMAMTLPSLMDRLQVHKSSTPLFEAHGIENALDRLLDTRLPVPGGGWITIERSEALTTIDVNSGEDVSSHGQQQTAVVSDLRAIPLIARQLRLRDIGGMIVIDFIPTTDKTDRTRIVDALKAALRPDSASSVVLGWTRMGLVEMTRRRSRNPLSDFLAGDMPTIRRRTKSAASTGFDILRRVKAEAHAQPGRPLIVTADSAVIAWLETPDRQEILQAMCAGGVALQPRSDHPVDSFDVFSTG